MTRPAFKRILLKLSGEVLMGQGQFGIDPETVDRVAGEIAVYLKEAIIGGHRWRLHPLQPVLLIGAAARAPAAYGMPAGSAKYHSGRDFYWAEGSEITKQGSLRLRSAWQRSAASIALIEMKRAR